MLPDGKRFPAALLLALLMLCTVVSAQDARLSIGMDGELVTGRWNPFEFSFRDARDVTLTFTIDQGDLRTGAVPAVYTFALAGGPGLNVIEDDLFLPVWQSFSWSASTASRVMASGSFHPRELDTRPLAVVLSTNAARHTDLLPAGSRLVAMPTARLPERLSAWDGVELLVVDGSTAPPPLAVIAAAATAGANVLLVEPLPLSFSELELLTVGPVTRLGAGRLLLGTGPELTGLLEPLLDGAAVETVLAERNELELKPAFRLVILLPVLIAYCILTVLLSRLAGVPGALAAVSLGLLAVMLSWPALRSEPRISSSQLELKVSAGGLSRSFSVYRLLDRTGGELQLTGQYRPLTARTYAYRNGESMFSVERWNPLNLVMRPQLATAGDGSGATDQTELLTLFPPGSRARISGNLIEIFLPEATE